MISVGTPEQYSPVDSPFVTRNLNKVAPTISSINKAEDNIPLVTENCEETFTVRLKTRKCKDDNREQNTEYDNTEDTDKNIVQEYTVIMDHNRIFSVTNSKNSRFLFHDREKCGQGLSKNINETKKQQTSSVSSGKMLESDVLTNIKAMKSNVKNILIKYDSVDESDKMTEEEKIKDLKRRASERRIQAKNSLKIKQYSLDKPEENPAVKIHHSPITKINKHEDLRKQSDIAEISAKLNKLKIESRQNSLKKSDNTKRGDELGVRHEDLHKQSDITEISAKLNKLKIETRQNSLKKYEENTKRGVELNESGVRHKDLHKHSDIAEINAKLNKLKIETRQNSLKKHDNSKRGVEMNESGMRPVLKAGEESQKIKLISISQRYDVPPITERDTNYKSKYKCNLNDRKHSYENDMSRRGRKIDEISLNHSQNQECLQSQIKEDSSSIKKENKVQSNEIKINDNKGHDEMIAKEDCSKNIDSKKNNTNDVLNTDTQQLINSSDVNKNKTTEPTKKEENVDDDLEKIVVRRVRFHKIRSIEIVNSFDEPSTEETKFDSDDKKTNENFTAPTADVGQTDKIDISSESNIPSKIGDISLDLIKIREKGREVQKEITELDTKNDKIIDDTQIKNQSVVLENQSEFNKSDIKTNIDKSSERSDKTQPNDNAIKVVKTENKCVKSDSDNLLPKITVENSEIITEKNVAEKTVPNTDKNKIFDSYGKYSCLKIDSDNKNKTLQDKNRRSSFNLSVKENENNSSLVKSKSDTILHKLDEKLEKGKTKVKVIRKVRRKSSVKDNEIKDTDTKKIDTLLSDKTDVLPSKTTLNTEDRLLTQENNKNNVKQESLEKQVTEEQKIISDNIKECVNQEDELNHIKDKNKSDEKTIIKLKRRTSTDDNKLSSKNVPKIEQETQGTTEDKLPVIDIINAGIDSKKEEVRVENGEQHVKENSEVSKKLTASSKTDNKEENIPKIKIFKISDTQLKHIKRTAVGVQNKEKEGSVNKPVELKNGDVLKKRLSKSDLEDNLLKEQSQIKETVKEDELNNKEKCKDILKTDKIELQNKDSSQKVDLKVTNKIEIDSKKGDLSTKVLEGSLKLTEEHKDKIEEKELYNKETSEDKSNESTPQKSNEVSAEQQKLKVPLKKVIVKKRLSKSDIKPDVSKSQDLKSLGDKNDKDIDNIKLSQKEEKNVLERRSSCSKVMKTEKNENTTEPSIQLCKKKRFSLSNLEDGVRRTEDLIKKEEEKKKVIEVEIQDFESETLKKEKEIIALEEEIVQKDKLEAVPKKGAKILKRRVSKNGLDTAKIKETEAKEKENILSNDLTKIVSSQNIKEKSEAVTENLTEVIKENVPKHNLEIPQSKEADLKKRRVSKNDLEENLNKNEIEKHANKETEVKKETVFSNNENKRKTSLKSAEINEINTETTNQKLHTKKATEKKITKTAKETITAENLIIDETNDYKKPQNKCKEYNSLKDLSETNGNDTSLKIVTTKKATEDNRLELKVVKDELCLENEIRKHSSPNENAKSQNESTTKLSNEISGERQELKTVGLKIDRNIMQVDHFAIDVDIATDKNETSLVESVKQNECAKNKEEMTQLAQTNSIQNNLVNEEIGEHTSTIENRSEETNNENFELIKESTSANTSQEDNKTENNKENEKATILLENLIGNKIEEKGVPILRRRKSKEIGTNVTILNKKSENKYAELENKNKNLEPNEHFEKQSSECKNQFGEELSKNNVSNLIDPELSTVHQEEHETEKDFQQDKKEVDENENMKVKESLKTNEILTNAEEKVKHTSIINEETLTEEKRVKEIECEDKQHDKNFQTTNEINFVMTTNQETISVLQENQKDENYEKDLKVLEQDGNEIIKSSEDSIKSEKNNSKTVTEELVSNILQEEKTEESQNEIVSTEKIIEKSLEDVSAVKTEMVSEVNNEENIETNQETKDETSNQLIITDIEQPKYCDKKDKISKLKKHYNERYVRDHEIFLEGKIHHSESIEEDSSGEEKEDNIQEEEDDGNVEKDWETYYQDIPENQRHDPKSGLEPSKSILSKKKTFYYKGRKTTCTKKVSFNLESEYNSSHLSSFFFTPVRIKIFREPSPDEDWP